MKINPKRIRDLTGQGAVNYPAGGAAAYWMSRDQRVSDNWALVYARQLADEKNIPLMVIFCLAEDYPGANLRHYSFMLRGRALLYGFSQTGIRRLYHKAENKQDAG